jgi:hypothetical protein
MQIVNLYKYERADGGITVSPIKPDCEYIEMYRLIADEGKVLKKGDIEMTCVDIETNDLVNWQEVDAPIEKKEETNV